MAEIVNLRLARKARSRREKEAAAGMARARHGETTAMRRQREAEEARAARRHDGHRLGPDRAGDADDL